MIIALNTKMHKVRSILKFQQGRNALNWRVTCPLSNFKGKLLKLKRFWFQVKIIGKVQSKIILPLWVKNSSHKFQKLSFNITYSI